MQQIIRAAACLTFFLAGSLQAGPGEEKTGFINKVYKGAEGEGKYVVYIPKAYKGDKEFPLILFLHGSGGIGDGRRKAGKVGHRPGHQKEG